MKTPRWLFVWIAAIGLVAPAGAEVTARAPADQTVAGPRWNMSVLGRAPRAEPAEAPTAEDLTAVFYDGLPWRGQPTRVFAYYGLPKAATGKVPGMVLVHGGGGTAFESWVRLWNSRGYAAIAMDTCGCVPIGSYGKWQRHAAGGPPGWGGFEQIDEAAEDQWTYHAVAGVILAHSLLRSLPEVDPERIGLTGISWGGYLTCIVAGVDSRFRFAAPVYGCGFLGKNSPWLAQFQEMGPDKAERWLGWWDPAVWLPGSRMPMLWVTGTNDFAYPLDSLQQSYRLPREPRTLCIRVRMPHGHGGAGENPGEILAFAEHHLRGGKPLARITDQGRAGDRAWATFESATPLARGELIFTRQAGRWQDRTWETAAAELDASAGRVTARLPDDVRVYYFNLIDAQDLVVSSEHVEVD